MFALGGGKGKRAEPDYILYMVHARVWRAHTRNNARRHNTPKPPITQNCVQK